jgi:uncharacterized protein (TIGR02266 family)
MSAPALVAVKTVIVADDTAFVRDRFKAALEGAGHRTVTVQTAAELLARLRLTSEPAHLIVLDLRLPQGRGLALLRAIQKLDATPPPIVVFSGTIASAAEVRELAALGVAGYVNEYASEQHILPALAPHLFPEHYNRRASPRVVLGIPVAYRFGNTIASALTLNVSTGGLALRTTSPLEVGTELKVRFRAPGTKKEIEAQGRVAWVDRRVGMGVQFTTVAPADHTIIDDWVQSHFFTNRKA